MTDLLAPFTAWLPTLPPWSQPAVATFIPCFVVLALLAIRHRVSLHRRGERFTRHKSKPAEMIGGLLVAAAFFYFRGRYPLVAQMLSWPDRTFPWYHRHVLQFWLGFGAAAYAARFTAALFAAIFLRGSGSRGGGGSGIGVGVRIGGHTLLPDLPPGFGWFSQPKPPERIIRTRTYKVEE